jgi:carbon storage regulator
VLTLTRKVGDQIKIGNDIVIEIREIRGRQVRVGVVAPKELVITRAELDPLPGPSPDEILAMDEAGLRAYCVSMDWDYDEVVRKGRLMVQGALAGVEQSAKGDDESEEAEAE